ncbi:MAG TPA: response regulator, partial [Gemmatimonadales bacterium]|nr:response regulator [Gemmatimonadales bacterium]
RVFEPFFTTKDLGKGTGLGLATVYGLVRQAGGDIALKSEPGRGCLAIIHFPRARVEQTARVEDRSTAPSERGGGETLLLVEDEAPVRQVTGRILAESGYRVIAAEDGDSALRRLAADQRIDLLVADVVTPGMGGRALADRILARDPDTRVLFISGYTSDAQLEDLLGRPGVGFLAKPFTAPQLQRAVRLLLDAPRTG